MKPPFQSALLWGTIAAFAISTTFTTTSAAYSRHVSFHIALEYGPDTMLGWDRYDFTDESWPPPTSPPADITIVKLIKHGETDTEGSQYQVTHVLRGTRLEIGEIFNVQSQLAYGRTHILLGDPTAPPPSLLK
ncbi:MAG: hypothetical protein AAF226_08985, partial [Verrucomicrobiota bacterium]